MITCLLSSRQAAVTPQAGIVLAPAIHDGKPIIAGFRLPATVVVESLAGGMTFERCSENMTSQPTTFAQL